MQGPSLEERSAILNEKVRKYVKKGYRVQSTTATTAQMVRPKRFSFLWAFVWFLLFGVGILVYFAWHAAKRDQTAYIEVDERGKTKIR